MLCAGIHKNMKLLFLSSQLNARPKMWSPVADDKVPIPAVRLVLLMVGGAVHMFLFGVGVGWKWR